MTTVIVLALGLLATPLACTTRVTPPLVGERAVTVWLIDYGRTPALVLPGVDGGYDQWVYGEYRWYALGETGLFRGVGALLLPTQGALGRKHFPPGVTADALPNHLTGAEARYAIAVHEADAVRLAGRLTAMFDARRDTLTRQAGGSMWFVHHPQPYTYFDNSNHMTARWLRELGCDTRGPAFMSRWRVLSPTETRPQR